MRTALLLSLFVALATSSPTPSSSSFSAPAHLFDPLIPTKLLATFNAQPPTPSVYPQYTTRDTGVWNFFGANTWTSGFLPVTFYALQERAELCPKLALDGAAWLARGRASSSGEIALEQKNTVGHDVGFLSFPFSEELRVNPQNATAVEAIHAFAADLAARFNPIVGCTRSWDTADPTDFQVIIDNMMNLEVLFASAALAPNETLLDIARDHADHTILNHIRPDGGSFHVVEYNSTTGVVIRRRTAQGYSDSSTWSRGQSWGIYGFANMFAHTGLQRYLDTARRMATYFITNTPSVGVVPWDFNAPADPLIADTSAAMIAVNGLLLLAQQEQRVGNHSGAAYYQHVAVEMVNTHSSQFWKPEWQSLLANGTVNAPQLNNLTGIVYGDYYFIRAGNEMIKQGLVAC